MIWGYHFLFSICLFVPHLKRGHRHDDDDGDDGDGDGGDDGDDVDEVDNDYDDDSFYCSVSKHIDK